MDAALTVHAGLPAVIRSGTKVTAAANDSPRIRIDVPMGESGARPANTGERSSLHDLVGLERTHLPAQYRQAITSGGVVVDQNVSLKTALIPGGQIVAVAGQAETTVRMPDGDTVELREHAYATNLRNLVIARGSAFLEYARSGAPQIVTHTGSLADGLDAEKNRALLQMAGMQEPVEFLHRLGSRSALSMLRALDRLRAPLESLRTSARSLAAPDALSPYKASPSDPDVLSVQTGASASEGSTTVEVIQTAQAQVAASRTNLSESPGLSGSFVLNGVTIAVTATDTVFDIVRTINRGTGVDDDGIYVGGEGSSADSRARASFVDGRLRFESLVEGPQGIQVKDDNGVLAAMGVVETVDGKLQFKNVLTEGREAQLRVNGDFLRRDTNTVTDAVTGVTLSLRNAGESTVTVTKDAAPALQTMRSFVASFNVAMDALDARLIRTTGSADSDDAAVATEDPAVQGIRVRLERNVTDPVAGQPEASDRASDVGLSVQPKARATFSQDTLSSVARELRAGLVLDVQRKTEHAHTVFNALDEIGLLERDDGTLSLDEETFSAALAAHPTDVAGLFTRDDAGISARLENTLHDVLDETRGTLALRAAAITSLVEGGLRQLFGKAMLQTNNAQQLASVFQLA